jgi:hypothetical protein
MVPDPQFGTAITDFASGRSIPVMWRPGFSGRRKGSDVVVFDASGSVVAETSHGYRIQGTYWPPLSADDGATSSTVWYACGSIEPSATDIPTG